MDGDVYDGVVKAKEQAQQQYTEAVSQGQSAGIVRYKDKVQTHAVETQIWMFTEWK